MGNLEAVQLAGQPERARAAFYDVPHHSVTASKLITNFLRNGSDYDVKDIVVVMDGSIGRDDFNEGKTALRKMIGSLREGENDTKYAAVTFSSSARPSSARVNFSFVPWQLAEKQVLNLPFPTDFSNSYAVQLAEWRQVVVEPSSADRSNILAALTEVKKLFDDPSSGCRINATKMAFLLIDNQSNVEDYFAKLAANELTSIGVRIFVVAVGSSIVGSSKLAIVASSPPEQFFFRVESLVGFLDVVELAIKELYATVYNVVPPPNVTAIKLVNNFLFSTYAVNTRVRAPTQSTKEDITKDIVIVLDSSGSIGSDEFHKGKTALRNMMELERQGGNDTKYAAVTFSDVAVVNFSFLPCAKAENRISTIPYRDGGTNTQAGLAEAKKLFDNLSTGRRVNATKNVFLVTDGHSNINEHLTIPMADELKKSGVQIFVVAVGGYIEGVDELANVASSPPEQFLFRVQSLEGFLQIVQLAVKEIYPGKYVFR